MPGFLDALMSVAVTAVLGLTAAAQLYQAWRAIEEAAAVGGPADQAARRRRASTHGRLATAGGGVDLAALAHALGVGSLTAVQDGASVRIRTPDGETVLIFQGTAAAMAELGALLRSGGGGLGVGDGDGDGDGARQVRKIFGGSVLKAPLTIFTSRVGTFGN
jgi:hypothetical protein